MCPSKRSSIPTTADPLTLAANKLSGQYYYEEGNLNMISQPPFQTFILPSNAFLFSLFSWPKKYQHLLSNTSFMLKWKLLIPSR